MRQGRLTDLALMNIEREKLKAINWDEIINNFADAKVRKFKQMEFFIN